ncbi:ATP-binding protein [Dactylosporangium sp. NPDC000521]|uniref:HD domain-containing protein n=1 Tax=Dactylosporangium sp. NPDC000521 TaxID=3363975 RepID=UPI0036B0B143
MAELVTRAEAAALEATSLPAFDGINLRQIKREITELLRHVGELGIFETYSRHDIGHVNSMLQLLDWVIPKETQEAMTPADWLLTVLSVYFHDLGMLVTRDEFNARNFSGFDEYRRTRLETSDDRGRDYTAAVKTLGDATDEFLYEEFVRANHAERSKLWVEGSVSKRLGDTEGVRNAIAPLLAGVDSVFRADLGLVCESHHLNDLDDTNKYQVRRPYGGSAAEIANVQYVAVLLRTVDLLQITRDRTPSIAFRILNPSDPLSRREWAKQMAVRAMLAQPKTDRDGNVSTGLQPDTIDVHAHFKDEEGFFALTNYLAYARGELEVSHKLIEASAKKFDVPHRFPWRDINESTITTDGFLPRQFVFEINQAKILDLLTGHTLYNDSRVVLREIVQNAIDAVRLQHSDEKGGGRSNEAGAVAIRWYSNERILEVKDNGTGMTQEIIEDNFLSVGTSRYQSDQFKKQYPNFNPISRFGIGVLTTFMIADAVDVVTCHPDDQKARQISLRSVHGKYLIRVLDKETDERVKTIAPHGTVIRLSVRPSIKAENWLALAKSWFIIPGCRLTLQIDEEPPVEVGHEDAAGALEEALGTIGYDDNARQIEIRKYRGEIVDLAYAVEWQPYFRSWEFVSIDSVATEQLVGTCVEGVRVRVGSPGFSDAGILAIANLSGLKAPRTNVARSDIDDTPEYAASEAEIYAGYCDHLKQQLVKLQADNKFSPSKASAEVGYIAAALMLPFRDRQRTNSASTLLLSAMPERLKQELRKIPLIVVEDAAQRKLMSMDELSKLPSFFTLTEPLIRRTEHLLRELPTAASLTDLINSVSGLEIMLPPGPLVVNDSLYETSRFFRAEWRLIALTANPQVGRLECKWSMSEAESQWIHVTVADLKRNSEREFYASITQTVADPLTRRWRAANSIAFPVSSDSAVGLDDYDAVSLGGAIYLLPGRPWFSLFEDQYVRALGENDREALAWIAAVTVGLMSSGPSSLAQRQATLKTLRRHLDDREVWSNKLDLDWDLLAKAVAIEGWAIFDPVSWDGRSGYLL